MEDSFLNDDNLYYYWLERGLMDLALLRTTKANLCVDRNGVYLFPGTKAFSIRMCDMYRFPDLARDLFMSMADQRIFRAADDLAYEWITPPVVYTRLANKYASRVQAFGS